MISESRHVSHGSRHPGGVLALRRAFRMALVQPGEAVHAPP